MQRKTGKIMLFVSPNREKSPVNENKAKSAVGAIKRNSVFPS